MYCLDDTPHLSFNTVLQSLVRKTDLLAGYFNLSAVLHAGERMSARSAMVKAASAPAEMYQTIIYNML